MSQQDMDLLLWLHAEAVWQRQRDNEFHMRVRFDVEAVLDEALGTEEEDGAGEGLAADVALLARRAAASEASRRDWAAEAMRLEHELDVARGAEGKVLTEYEKLLKTYELKLNDFARETARVSAALQACDPDRVPLRVVGEALLGYEMAQRDIARAIETAAAVHPEADRAGEVDRG